MKESITSRINNLRTYMKAHGLAAYIFPSTDPQRIPSRVLENTGMDFRLQRFCRNGCRHIGRCRTVDRLPLLYRSGRTTEGHSVPLDERTFGGHAVRHAMAGGGSSAGKRRGHGRMDQLRRRNPHRQGRAYALRTAP